MRRAAYSEVWEQLGKSRKDEPPVRHSLGAHIEIDVAEPCIVLGGKNGAGKTRVLRQLKALEEPNSVLIDLYRLAELALSTMRSRDDLHALKEEYDPLVLSKDTKTAIDLIVGQEYDAVQWYSIALDPSDASGFDQFKWGGDEYLFPYFEVNDGRISYSMLDMGHGEFCVHLLFWILEQYREAENLLILLDEPDAFLPPVGVSTLLQNVLALCLKKNWRVIVATHAEEMIRQARENDAFVLLVTGPASSPRSIHCLNSPTAGDTLLTPPPYELVLFCEDESAQALTRAILDIHLPALSRQISLVWGSGFGYLNGLQKHLPRPKKPDVSFVLVFDGDKRGASDVSRSTSKQWPAIFLPTDNDPDNLLKSTRSNVDDIAAMLGHPVDVVAETLDSLRGEEPHDWVNELGDRYGRQQVLAKLSRYWCQQNPVQAQQFVEDLKEGLGLVKTDVSWLRSVVRQTEGALGRRHDVTTEIRTTLAEALVRAGDLDEAAEIYRLVIRQQPADGPQAAARSVRLAEVLETKGDLEGAGIAYESAVDILGREYGDDDSRTQAVKRALQRLQVETTSGTD